MSIWYKDYDIDKINDFNKNTLIDLLKIEITELREKSIVGTMEVTQNHYQPHGVMHGGASVVLAESLGSIAANLVLNPKKYYAVGQCVNANHLRPVRSGVVTAEAEVIHLGKNSQVWNIRVLNEKENIICISRLTMAVLEMKKD